MLTRLSIATIFFATALCLIFLPGTSPACCPAPPLGKPVVNADQTVIILWDPATKTEHFIRQASFKSAADDFAFLVPTPSQPELNESGNEAFPLLRTMTEPPIAPAAPPGGGMSCGCDKEMTAKSTSATVEVLQQKRVAGFDAVVLRADTPDVLMEWLKDHGYAFSPEVKAWAEPYVKDGWKITALKVSKSRNGETDSEVDATALRMTFKTDRPLFPYREPDPTQSAPAVGATHRLLRIYFLSDARYAGTLTPGVSWTGKTAWANKVADADRSKVLDLLKLPAATGPAQWWLTEFEDEWPYRVAPADVYFSQSADQSPVQRQAVPAYSSRGRSTDGTPYVLAAVVIIPAIAKHVRRRKYWS